MSWRVQLPSQRPSNYSRDLGPNLASMREELNAVSKARAFEVPAQSFAEAVVGSPSVAVTP